jgi:hypothetical protein
LTHKTTSPGTQLSIDIVQQMRLGHFDQLSTFRLEPVVALRELVGDLLGNLTCASALCTPHDSDLAGPPGLGLNMHMAGRDRPNHGNWKLHEDQQQWDDKPDDRATTT